MKLWTIQHQNAWKKAEATGVLKSDGRRIYTDFKPAYRWLIEQMHQKLPNYTDNYPIWAWAQPKPDLRQAGHLPKGTLGVRVEFIADEQDVLLSHFDAWHMPLNNWHLALTEEEGDQHWEAAQKARHDPQTLKPLQQAVLESWERVFDLELLRQSEWDEGAEYIQATLGHVCLDQVIKVDYFASR